MAPVKNGRSHPRKETVVFPPRVLLVQVDSEVETGLHLTLERHGFRVVTKATIKDALACISELKFAALICDLHLPAAGDGFTLLNAMRHLHPDAVSIIMSDYAPLRESLAELLRDPSLERLVPLRELRCLIPHLVMQCLHAQHRTHAVERPTDRSHRPSQPIKLNRVPSRDPHQGHEVR